MIKDQKVAYRSESIEVLVVTVDQNSHDLVRRMNLKTNAIIGNQCENNQIDQYYYEGHRIKVLSFAERGVGLNRNNVLMRAEGDICVLADDDIVFCDDYEEIVKGVFRELPDADVVIFAMEDDNPHSRQKRVNEYNYTKYGAARIAFRRKSVWLHGVFFNLCFGGGARYSAGEDTLFLHDCLQKGLRIYYVPYNIARFDEYRRSTWFKGYNEKFFFDKGLIYSLLFGKTAGIRLLISCLVHREYYDYSHSFLTVYHWCKNGKRARTKGYMTECETTTYYEKNTSS